MSTVLLIIHLFVTILLIGVVLIQRSEGGGLGIGTSQGMGSFMSGRGTANLLTRTTAILAAIFMALSMALAVLNKGGGVQRSILDTVPAMPAPMPVPGGPAVPAPSAPTGTAPSAPAGAAPSAPAGAAPSVPTGTVPSAPAGSTPSAPAGSAPSAPATTSPATAPAAPAAKAPTPAAPSSPSAPTN